MLTLPRIPSQLPRTALRSRFAGFAAAVGVFALAAAPALGQPAKPWLHVQVQDDSDETKVEVNLPLAAVEALGDSMGERMLEEATRRSEDGVELKMEDLRAFWEALRAEPGARVQLAAEDGGGLDGWITGDEVRIEGSGDDGSLEIRFPVAVLDALFSGAGEEPDFRRAIRSLGSHEGDLVSMRGEDGQVRVWIGPQ